MFTVQLMFCIIYVYAALGVAFFGGTVSKDKHSTQFAVLSKMAFGENGYWLINFNDMPSGFVLMVQLLVVNNWMVFTEAFVAVTSPAAFIFFCSFYLFGVIAGMCSYRVHALKLSPANRELQRSVESCSCMLGKMHVVQ